MLERTAQLASVIQTLAKAAVRLPKRTANVHFLLEQ